MSKFDDLQKLKQERALKKAAYFRSLSDEERQQLNDANAELCAEIAKQFEKSRPFPKD